MTRNATLSSLALMLGIALALIAGCLFCAGESAHAASASGSALQPGTAKVSTAATTQSTAAPAIRYRTRAINKNWQAWRKDGKTTGTTGNSHPLIAAAVELTVTIPGSVHYQVHVTDVGWLAVASDGKVAKPLSGINRPIDAVRLDLSGSISKTYSVAYRVYLQGSGWQAWKADGDVAGDASKGIGVQAMQVKLAKKAKTSTAARKGIVGVRYRANTQTSGWSQWKAGNAIAGYPGKGRRADGFQIALDTGTYRGGVEYRVHYRSGKWSVWKANGASVGSGAAVNGIQVRLTGAIAKKYDVVYRAYLPDIGWQRRMRNGETAGTAGDNLRIEALRVNLVAKSNASGWVKSNGKWSYYQAGKKRTSSWIATDEHPIATKTAGSKRYWVDSKGFLAVGRYVNPSQATDKKAGYIAYATKSGYVARGKFKNDDGMLLSDKSTGRIYTGTRWVKTSAFDGKEQIYRLVQKGSIAVVKTGLFQVGGKSYYAFTDGKGYLMRSSRRYIDGAWYEADANGVLTKDGDAASQAIERYVAWAIATANDNSHGYSQVDRWGPDYDCSSFVCASLQAAGFPDSGASWTGNMKGCLTKIGFKWHAGTSGLRRGDIVLAHNDSNQHTEIYIGSNKLVGAHSSETGGITGKTGDQTGREISVANYYDMPWDGYLRYKG